MNKLSITVTKAHLEEAKNCGTDMSKCTAQNCAIAIAVRDIFPNAEVGYENIHPFGTNHVLIPHNQTAFLKLFDSLFISPELRLQLPELTFTVDLPDEVIDMIDISELDKVEHLKLV